MSRYFAPCVVCASRILRVEYFILTPQWLAHNYFSPKFDVDMMPMIDRFYADCACGDMRGERFDERANIEQAR